MLESLIGCVLAAGFAFGLLLVLSESPHRVSRKRFKARVKALKQAQANLARGREETCSHSKVQEDRMGGYYCPACEMKS